MTDGPPAEPSRRDALVRPAAGVALLLLAVLVYALSRLLASGQSHSYDPGASPPAGARLIAGKQYELSSPTLVSTLRKRGLLDSLSCSWSGTGGVQYQVNVVSIMNDDRNLRTFAAVTAPATGRFQVSCIGIDRVFVDDAEDSSRDTSAAVLLLSALIGVLGVPLAVSGWYRLPPMPQREDVDDGEPDSDLFDDERV
ncbi:MAG TPA: hypothetical protein VJ851_11460 [Jatrophihabitans sp.]|nr:hypothetical protein [Jatrophihabitans sp.]